MSDDQIRVILVAVARVEEQVKGIREDITDLKPRVSSLERVRWIVVGFALAIGGSGGAIATRLLG